MVYDQTVVNKDRGQKVFSQTFLEFSDRMVAQSTASMAASSASRKNRPLFQQVEQQFGVPAPGDRGILGARDRFRRLHGQPADHQIGHLARL